jgi:hypothetical protein
MQRQSKGSRGLETYCNGGQGPSAIEEEGDVISLGIRACSQYVDFTIEQTAECWI